MEKPPKSERKFLRQCRICRKYKKKEDLIRITRNYKTGRADINNDNTIQGRSLYICRCPECIEKFIKDKKSAAFLPIDSCADIKEKLAALLNEL